MVWPTNKETKNYFISVTSIIAVLAIVLFVFWTTFSQILFTAKNIINPAKVTPVTTSGSKDVWTLSWLNLGNIQTETKPVNTKTK